MGAARRERYGPSEVIRVEDVAVPTPVGDELLVRVHAATVSRTDCALLSARPFFMRFLTGLYWQNPFLALITPVLGGQRVVFPIPIARKAFLEVMRPLVVERHFRPVIDRIFERDAIAEAYAYVASGTKDR
jgi:NADPH:quinone reductase-like Zn-dependent oxidoreductase